MKDIYYKSSEGVIIDLISPPYMMLSDTDMFNWEWQYETVGNNYPYITAFKNQMISRTINIVISGNTVDDLMQNLEHLEEVTDRDVRLQQVGRLYVGNYFRECFIVGNTKNDKVFNRTKTTITLTVVSEEGDWKSEQPNSYSGLSGGKYLNNYAVPEVTSDSEEFEYYAISDIESEFRFMTPYDNEFNVSDYETFTIKTLTGDVQYNTGSGSYTTVHPEDCPYTIDCSLYEHIYIKASTFVIMEYLMDADNNATHIYWMSAYTDEMPIFSLDLGTAIELKKISGLKIGQGHQPEFGDEECYLQISEDGINWTQVDSCAIPTTLDTFNTLEKTWSSDYPAVRYIRVISSPISTPPPFTPYSIKTNSFKVEAHFESEEQNVALSAVYTKSNMNETYWSLDDVLAFELQGYGTHSMRIDLPAASDIVKIGNISVDTTGTDLYDVYVEYMDAELHTHELQSYRVTVTNPVSINLTELELNDVVSIVIRSNGSIRYRCGDFQILQEQQEAPHRYILNENYVPSDAIIKIYGPTNEPSIFIGDNQYGAEDLTLLADEYLEVNTKEETLKHYTGEDSWNNVYYRRLDNTFDKIEVGTSEITWQGNIRVDIELLNARSGPKWN